MRSSKSGYTFSRVPSVARPRSAFDRSRTYKTTFDEGLLIPFYWDEVLPGDTIANLNVTAFSRLSTPIVPIMDNLWMQFFFFFVPNRLVWENWQRFCGEQENPEDSTDYLVPQVEVPASAGGAVVGTIYDYFGLPTGVPYTVDSLLFRSYNLVWNEFFRDENLQNSVPVPCDDGPDTYTDFALLRRGKRKTDPFTSALPFPQKGPGVELPIGTDAPVVFKSQSGGKFPASWGFNTSAASVTLGSGEASPFSGLTTAAMSVVNTGSTSETFKTSTIGLGVGTSGDSFPLYADLAATTSVTINALREAFQIQKWYEQLARGGSRYQELVLSMFGVHTGDARLQRPEYLGGGKVPVQIHAVAQTSATDLGTVAVSDTPQGNMAAFGVAGASGIGFSKSFVEHGHVLGLVCVYADYTYFQGIDRMWTRRNKFDFYWPAFAHLGEVGIKNSEIYYQNNASVDNKIFGYQERWFEYRYGVNKVTGLMRPGVGGTLSYWHLAQQFTSLPTLSSDFIEEHPPIDRVVAVQDEPHFIFDSLIKCRTVRCMPVYSVPGLVDHF